MAQNNVLQYVGARYVPVFYNNPNGTWDWLSGVQYEPLTIVKYGTNTYTSKKLVPSTVGSPNLNPAYWALTGDYNGAIIQLQTQISENTEKLTKTENVDDWSNRKYCLIADSYGTPNLGGWVKSATQFITSRGASVISSAVGGSGFIGNVSTGNTFLKQLKSLDLSGITHVVIGGNANDVNAQISSIQSAVEEVDDYIDSQCPKATKMYFAPGQYTTFQSRKKLVQVTNQIKIDLQARNWIVASKDYTWLHSFNAISEDGVHPSTSGTLYLKWLVNCFLNGQYDVCNNALSQSGTYRMTFSKSFTFTESGVINFIEPGEIPIFMPAETLFIPVQLTGASKSMDLALINDDGGIALIVSAGDVNKQIRVVSAGMTLPMDLY